MHLLARRGPLQVAFTIKEFRDILRVDDVAVTMSPDGFDYDPGVWFGEVALCPICVSVFFAEILQKLSRPRRRLSELVHKTFTEQNSSTVGKRHCNLAFLRSPKRLVLNDEKRLTALEIYKNRMEERSGEDVTKAVLSAKVRLNVYFLDDRLLLLQASETNETELLPCQLCLVSIGYQSVRIEGLPFDERRNVLPTGRLSCFSLSFLESCIIGADGCRVIEGDTILNGVYACGWCATGATGVIVDTQIGSKTCAKVVAEDVRSGKHECAYLLSQSYPIQVVSPLRQSHRSVG